MPSRTALVIASQGDPIFGALARLAIRGVRAVRGIIKTVRAARGSTQIATRAGTIATRARGGIVSIAKSRTGRVLAEVATVGGATAIGVRVGQRAPAAPGFQVEGNVQFSPSGCPIGKIVDVAAHQRVIPLDRFGRPRRRIDVLNTKALARATRRLGGFQKRARRVEKQLAKIAPRSRSRRRSKGVC